MSDRLRTRPAATPAMLDVWSDAATVRHALAFEAALADALAAEGLIDPRWARSIGAACATLRVDFAELADEAAHAGTLAIPLVARLRATVGGEAAAAVHRGATSQDVADTVMMLQVRAAAGLILRDVDRIVAALIVTARSHAATPAIGRTLLQDAMPVAWGLRLAHSAAGIGEGAAMLSDAVATHALVQLGGPVGTRAGMDGRGEAVTARVAATLGLAAGVPWHARRVGPAAVGAAVGLIVGAIGKLARDIALLAQNAVGEAREPAVAGRGGSSAMAHKRNPTGCQVALTAATRTPGLVATLLAAMVQEEERGIGNWQAEGPVLADLFLLAAGAAADLAAVIEGLAVDMTAIARNLAAAACGDDIGESEAIIAVLTKVAV